MQGILSKDYAFYKKIYLESMNNVNFLTKDFRLSTYYTSQGSSSMLCVCAIVIICMGINK